MVQEPAGLTVPRSPSSPVGLFYGGSQWGMGTGYKSHFHYLPDVKFLHFRPGSCSLTSPALLSSGGVERVGRVDLRPGPTRSRLQEDRAKGAVSGSSPWCCCAPGMLP